MTSSVPLTPLEALSPSQVPIPTPQLVSLHNTQSTMPGAHCKLVSPVLQEQQQKLIELTNLANRYKREQEIKYEQLELR